LKRVVILTYYWPPGSGPGVQRWLKFCKFLPDLGWEPIVITVKNGSYPSEDTSLLEDVPEDLKVIRTATLEPFTFYNLLRGKKGKAVEVGMGNIKGKQSILAKVSNYIRANFFIPDARIGWNIYAFPELLKVVKSLQPHALITTGPPHSTHLMGEKLCKSHDIKWIADMRDPWTTIYYNAFLNRTSASKERDQALENLVVRSASALIAASPGLKEEFADRARCIEFIPNGFDEEDFSGISVDPRKQFVLAYVGNLKSAQNISSLWSAIAALKQNERFATDFRLEITGNVSDDVKSSMADAGIMDVVDIKPFVPHKEAIARMVSAHLLLLPIPQSQGNGSILTGKLFEYLATRRPILSIGPVDGNASAILHACGKEAMLAYEDQDGIAQLIAWALEEYRLHHSPLVTGNASFRTYSRLGSTETLVKLLNSLTA
jgi:glycosyltransferase involved in cell wall biosynthesis